MFLFLNVGILYLSGENFRFLLLFFHYSCKRRVFIYLYSFCLIWCAGSVGISLAGRVMYIFCACISPLWDWRAGTILFGHSCGVDGGTVQFSFSSGSIAAGTVRVKW